MPAAEQKQQSHERQKGKNRKVNQAVHFGPARMTNPFYPPDVLILYKLLNSLATRVLKDHKLFFLVVRVPPCETSLEKAIQSS